MDKEIKDDRSARIVGQLKEKYPGKKAYDLDGRGEHFVCEVEPVTEHAEYDRAVEVIISSTPHKHLKMTQTYKVLSGTLDLHVGENTVKIGPGGIYTVHPGNVHWAKSDDECSVEIYSEPGWTKEDHISVEEAC